MAKKKKKSTVRNRFTPFFIFISLTTVAIGIIFLYQPYRNYYYNFSMNKSELAKEIQYKTIPEDIKQEMELEQKNVPAVKAYTIPVLMYHYVENVKDKDDTIRISLNTPPIVLEEQIKTLINAGYTFMTNEDLANILGGRYELPSEHPVVLTFDDGYRDFYTDVFPLLKKYNIKATNYVVSGFINRPNYLLDSQIQEMVDSGLVEIGAHTVNHTSLKGNNLKEVTNEAAQSKTELESRFNTKVVSFAYPFGAFDKQAADVVKSIGFKSAVSTIPGIEQNEQNKFFLFRLRPGRRTGQELLIWLSQKNFTEF